VITQPIKTPRLLRRRTNQKIPARSQQWALLLVAAQHQIAYWLHHSIKWLTINQKIPADGGHVYLLQPQHQMAYYNNNNNDRLTAFDPGQPG